jgi:hypothetical protein
MIRSLSQPTFLTPASAPGPSPKPAEADAPVPTAAFGAAVLEKVRQDPDVAAAHKAIDDLRRRATAVDGALASNWQGRMALVPDLAAGAFKDYKSINVAGNLLSLGGIAGGVLIGTQHVFGPASGLIALGILTTLPWVAPWGVKKYAEHEANQTLTRDLTAEKGRLTQALSASEQRCEQIEGAALQRVWNEMSKNPAPAPQLDLAPEQVVINGVSVPRRKEEA